MTDFGESLKLLRKNSALSQSDLAEELNVSRATIKNYEASITKPDIDFLILVSDYFSVTIDCLLGIDIPEKAYPTFTNLEKIAKFFNASPIELFGSQKDIVLSENNNQIIDDVLSKNKLYFAISEFCYDDMPQLTEIISLLERRNLSIDIQISGKVKTIKKG